MPPLMESGSLAERLRDLADRICDGKVKVEAVNQKYPARLSADSPQSEKLTLWYTDLEPR